MRRTFWLTSLAIVSVCALAAPVHADNRVFIGFHLDSRNAPPAPRIVIESEPRVEVVREVQVVNDPRFDDDMFRWHGRWFVCRDGWWYRANTWRGPWVFTDVHRVPRPIIDLPHERWKHRVWAEERREERREDRREDRGRHH